ncbi:nucleoside-diphosphate kinase [Candidatus Pacebacteria bacterium]|nr:nucleoside-diphosphate kinase [Candidatus Paceibacterota bacterium]
MEKAPHNERSLIILKPDAVQRSLIGEIISRFERKGLKFVAFKFTSPDEKHLFAHYNKDDAWFTKKGENMVKNLKEQGKEPEKEAIEYGKDIIRAVVNEMQKTPVLAIVVEGADAIAQVTRLVGTTEPATADIGTIRGDFSIDTYSHSTYEDRSIRNIIHCSDVPEEAEREIALWFDESELMNYVTAQERIMYDAHFDAPNA